ncbi:acyltransferase [Pseudolabrys taiwanensis]|uniref:Acyltransferase n=1 Tax=Pseudolabrys taiwanensis TaxID=331696 RepID=A0A345ZV36_9HYPH|nr:acyltransferase [Pseudolabrys taiwanensis]AXK80783.1 acyltransferase [Pseudolabrys taiwanensis]
MAKAMRFEALDSWRGICALCVVMFHFIGMMPSSLETSPFLRNSYLFVDFFFVLSGFVLCHSYRGKIVNPSDMLRFAIRRAGRVWPLHAVVLASFIALVVWINRLPHPEDLDLTVSGTVYSIDAIIPSALLLNAMGLVHGNVWNGPAWSIGAEFYVYLLFALLLLFSGRRLVLPCLALAVAGLILLHRWAPALMNSTWDYGIIRCIAGFFGGVVAFHVHEVTGQRGFFRATMWELGAIVVAVLFVIFAGDGADAVSPLSLAAPVVFGAAVIIFAGQQGLISLVLRARPFKALGRYSFSIYMIHQPLLIMLCYGLWSGGYYTKAFEGAVTQPWMGSVDLVMVDFMLAVVVLAAASYRFIEVPARRAFNRLADRPFAFRFSRKDRLAYDRSARLPYRLGVADHALDRG